MCPASKVGPLCDARLESRPLLPGLLKFITLKTQYTFFYAVADVMLDLFWLMAVSRTLLIPPLATASLSSFAAQSWCRLRPTYAQAPPYVVVPIPRAQQPRTL